MRHFLCDQIFILANRLVTRCRSEKEKKALQESFSKHFSAFRENTAKATQYDHIINQKDNIIGAIGAVKAEASLAKIEKEFIENEYQIILDENRALRNIIARICVLRQNEDFEELDQLIINLSARYLNIVDSGN